MNKINIHNFEIFKFGDNEYVPFLNHEKTYFLNKRTYLDIVLTDYCNQNCNFCIADLIHNKLTCDYKKFQDKILYAIDYLNVKDVLLLGGELTMSKHLVKIIEWLKSLNRLEKIVMTTNAVRLADEDYRFKIMKAGLTDINISFMNIDPDKQKNETNGKYVLTINDLKNIYEDAIQYDVKIRINNNVYVGNNDSLTDIVDFYNTVYPYCDSIKFSPLLETDSFSVIENKTEWVKTHRLANDQVLELFNKIEYYFSNKYNVSIIENNLQFGFVKNTMIPLKTPIIMNWNFGNFTGMMKKVVTEHKINNLKLLPNNELSLSWNRELEEYFIKTE